MMKTKLIAILCGLLVSSFANAECLSSLSKEEMMKCQQIEQTGITYEEYLDNQEDMAEAPTTSPITGKDVRNVSPAAGKSNIEPETTR